MHFALSGVKIPHYKNTADTHSVIMPAPDTVTIPMIQHIGLPSKPIVKVGDTVKVGQVIAEAGGYVGVPIHSSVSGIVKQFENIQLASGAFVEAIVIASDGEMTPCELISPKNVTNYNEFIAAVRDSGVVGFGGAGFPTAVKLDIKDLSRVDTIIINGAECEPYITSDTRTMLEDADYIVDGLRLLNEFLGVKNIIIGIENNKQKCIKLLKEKTGNLPFVKVKTLKSLYPQGAEKVIIYNSTGRIVPEGKLPIDVGVIVINCATLAAISKYIKTGMPVVSKCITVDGSAIKNPQNVIVPIGTSIAKVVEFCGGYSCEPSKILYGGLMMGISVKSDNSPVLKNNNAIIALNEKDSKSHPTTPCIRCGKCISSCPLKLNPVLISKGYKSEDADILKKATANLCMECGCCSYICPTKQPLVQRNKLAKAMLLKAKNKEAAK